MNRHGNDVLMMQVEELLAGSLYVLHDSNTSCGKDNTAILGVPQVSSRVETTETVGPLEGQVVVWGFAHDRLDPLVGVRRAILDIPSPHVNATSLIAFLKLDLTEFIITCCRSSKVILSIKVVFAVILKSFFVAFSIRLCCIDLGGLLSCLLVHEILPLEDGLVFAASRNQPLLAVRIPREADVCDVLRMARVLLICGFFDGARVLEQLHHSEVVTCCKHCTVGTALTRVDVGAVGARWKIPWTGQPSVQDQEDHYSFL